MGRVDRRRKKKKLAIWQKILIVIGMFIVAGVGGYFIGNLTGTKNETEENSAPKTEEQVKADKKQEVHKFKQGQIIPLDDSVSIEVKELKTYPKVDGPKFPLGLTVKMVNHGKKSVDMPYKYLFRLFLNDKDKAQSVGIYSVDSVAQQDLVAETDKLKPKEERTVVYMFSAPNKQMYQASKATLKLSVPKGQQIVSLKVVKQKGTATEKDSSTTASSVVQSESTSTTYEQTTQATVATSSSQEAAATQSTQQSQQSYSQPQQQNNNTTVAQSTTQQAQQTMNTATLPLPATPQQNAPANNNAANNANAMLPVTPQPAMPAAQ